MPVKKIVSLFPAEAIARRNSMPKTRRMALAAALVVLALFAFAAYHHQGERDSGNFLKIHPEKAGGKLDHCALCHGGGQMDPGREGGTKVTLGSCQWCHSTYGYDRKGPLAETLNAYGRDYLKHGRDAAAVTAIAGLDSDGDGFGNRDEIQADRFPGSAADDPGKTAAPMKVYARAQLEALPRHTQFLLQNAAKSQDAYAEFSGVTMEALLRDAGILDSASGITVFSPDGWSQYHPLRPIDDPAMYPVCGAYPEAVYHHPPEAESVCDYSAPSCSRHKPGERIKVRGGLRLLLALEREGRPLSPAVLSKENKLDGEGPYRVIVPQKAPSPPDRSSKSTEQGGPWAYHADWDHNAGSSTRAVTMIRVEPLPPGTTDIDTFEAGWKYVDEAKIVVYGAITRAEKRPKERARPRPPHS
jgi:hypothetical protein